MNIQQGISNVTAWVKKHPALSAAIVFTTVVVVWYVTRPRGTATSDGGYAGGGVPYVMPAGDGAASAQARALEAQTGLARFQIEAEKEVLLGQLNSAKEMEMLKLTTQKELTTLALTAQAGSEQKQFDLAKYALDMQFNPKTYAQEEIRAAYASVGREPTARDLTYWAGQMAGDTAAGIKLNNALQADQVVLAGVGVTKSESNAIGEAYARWGRTPTQDEIVYWGNYSGSAGMEAALSYQLEYDNKRLLTGG